MSVDIFKGNAVITYDSVVLGEIKSASLSQTQDTWDTTASDTVGARTALATWADGTATFGGIYDPKDAGQVKLQVGSADGTTKPLIIQMSAAETYTAQVIMTELTIEGDDEQGWTFSATFKKSGDGVFATAP